MNDAAILFAQSCAALADKDFALAETLLLQALKIEPTLAEAHANLAWLLERKSATEINPDAHLADAIEHYRQALALQPDNVQIHLNFGALLATQRQHEPAERAYRHALAIDPASAGAWCNLGALQALTQRDMEAETSLRKAIELDAAHASAHFNLSCLLLRKGRLKEGWQHLEYRNWYRAIASRLPFPRWQGGAVNGLAMLVVYEAGQGDVVQFCRYVNVLRDHGAARVDVLCHPPLKRLLQSLTGVSTVIGFDENLPEAPAPGWDFWVPLLSLPHHFGTTLESIPAVLPYLHTPQELAAQWESIVDAVAEPRKLRVGLVWRGSPQFENDSQRSLPSLQTLAPLWEVHGVQFFSLQKVAQEGAVESEIQTFGAQQALVDLGPHLGDFADTAAAIAQLDLVISVDTGVAHVAGALGKPCWLLLPAYMTDWRWLENRSDSPWYPGAFTLFRQQVPGDWEAAIAAAAEALRGLVASSPVD